MTENHTDASAQIPRTGRPYDTAPLEEIEERAWAKSLAHLAGNHDAIRKALFRSQPRLDSIAVGEYTYWRDGEAWCGPIETADPARADDTEDDPFASLPLHPLTERESLAVVARERRDDHNSLVSLLGRIYTTDELGDLFDLVSAHNSATARHLAIALADAWTSALDENPF